jgi:hypothetical protein
MSGSVVFIPGGAPSYNILSTDITAGSTVDGVSYIGALVRVIDTGRTYYVLPDLTLREFHFPVSAEVTVAGSSLTLGAVTISTGSSVIGTVNLGSGSSTMGAVDIRTDGSAVSLDNPLPVLVENGSGSVVSILTMPPVSITGSLPALAGTTTVNITGSLPALAGTTGTSESWRVSLISDTTGSQSSKTFTVPASTEYQVLWIWVDYTTGSTVGNRQLAVQTQSSASVVTGNWARTSVTLASGSTRSYLFASGVADLLGFRDTDYLTTPIPAGSFLSAGQKLKIFDNKAIAATQDTMNIQMQIASRTV